jgi:hypothetical protein
VPVRPADHLIVRIRRSGESTLAAVIEWLGRLPARELTAVSIALVGLMGVADYWTSRDISVAAAYMLPVFLAAAAGGRSSLGVAAISTMMWTGIEVLTKIGPPIPAGVVVWNLLARFAVLWLVGALVSHLAERLAEATDLSRTDPLTSLPNARSFRESADEELDRMRTRPATRCSRWWPGSWNRRSDRRVVSRGSAVTSSRSCCRALVWTRHQGGWAGCTRSSWTRRKAGRRVSVSASGRSRSTSRRTTRLT